MCQIDRLQRLKAESHVIKKTLATLPRTLDETYERIFQEIPEVEWPLVRQCLQWIEYHDHIYQDGIPSAILLSAVRSWDCHPNSGGNEYHLDEESLRDMCGCLIQISPGIGLPFYPSDPKYFANLRGINPVVSLAHYTVREFIESERISTGAAAYFKIGFDDIRVPMTRNALCFALDSWAEGHRTYLNSDDGFGYSTLTTDFAAYCAATAICVLHIWPNETTKLDGICDLFLESLRRIQMPIEGDS